MHLFIFFTVFLFCFVLKLGPELDGASVMAE